MFPLSGGISKDTILASGLQLGGFWGYLAFVGGVVGALLTGLYASRLMFVVFRGEPSEYAAAHAPHHTEHGEGPRTMMIPVYILTVLAATAGILQFPGVTHCVLRLARTDRLRRRADARAEHLERLDRDHRAPPPPA